MSFFSFSSFPKFIVLGQERQGEEIEGKYNDDPVAIMGLGYDGSPVAKRKGRKTEDTMAQGPAIEETK